MLELAKEVAQNLQGILQKGIEDPCQLAQTFFLSNDDDQKKSSKSNYSSTKVKAKNFLSNISYKRLSKNGHENQLFIVDVFTFIILNLNPFFLERKLGIQKISNYVNMLWDICIPHELYKFISLEESYYVLNQKDVIFNKANEIIKKFI